MTITEPSNRAKALKRAQDDLKKQHHATLIEERTLLLDKTEQNRIDLQHLGYTFKTRLEREMDSMTEQNMLLHTKIEELTAEVERLKKKR